MKGKVISLHDGFHLDVVQVEPIPPKAIVQFENGMRLMVDEQMRWERVAEEGQIAMTWCALEPIWNQIGKSREQLPLASISYPSTIH